MLEPIFNPDTDPYLKSLQGKKIENEIWDFPTYDPQKNMTTTGTTLSSILDTFKGYGAAAAEAYKSFNAPSATQVAKEQAKVETVKAQASAANWTRIALIGGAALVIVVVLAIVLRRR